MRSSFNSRRRNRSIYRAALFATYASMLVAAIPVTFLAYTASYVMQGGVVTATDAQIIGYAAIVGIGSVLAFLASAIVAVTHEA